MTPNDAEDLVNAIVRLLITGEPLDEGALRALVYDYWSRRARGGPGADIDDDGYADTPDELPDTAADIEAAHWERLGRAAGDWGM